MKAWKGVVITTYKEELTVLANTKEEAEVLMYDRANPMGDSVSGEMEVYDLKEMGEANEKGGSMNLVEQAMTAHWGEKCDEYEQGCPVCDAWREYENLVTYGETLTKVAQVDNNMFIEELMRKPVDVAIRNAVAKLIAEGRINDVDNKSR